MRTYIQNENELRTAINFIDVSKTEIIGTAKNLKNVNLKENEIISRSYYLMMFFEQEVNYRISIYCNNLYSSLVDTAINIDHDFDPRMINFIDGGIIHSKFNEIYCIINYFDSKVTPNLSTMIAYNISTYLYSKVIKNLLDYNVNSIKELIDAFGPLFKTFTNDINLYINQAYSNAMKNYLELGKQPSEKIARGRL